MKMYNQKTRQTDLSVRERLTKYRRRKRWMRTVSALAAVMVFVTTYSMILPTLTATRTDLTASDLPQAHAVQAGDLLTLSDAVYAKYITPVDVPETDADGDIVTADVDVDAPADANTDATSDATPDVDANAEATADADAEVTANATAIDSVNASAPHVAIVVNPAADPQDDALLTAALCDEDGAAKLVDLSLDSQEIACIDRVYVEQYVEDFPAFSAVILETMDAIESAALLEEEQTAILRGAVEHTLGVLSGEIEEDSETASDLDVAEEALDETATEETDLSANDEHDTTGDVAADAAEAAQEEPEAAMAIADEPASDADAVTDAETPAEADSAATDATDVTANDAEAVSDEAAASAEGEDTSATTVGEEPSSEAAAVSDAEEAAPGEATDAAPAEAKDAEAVAPQSIAGAMEQAAAEIREADGVLTASGEDYLITVTYGPDAEIPAAAALTVKEIRPEDENYAEYYAQSLATLDATDERKIEGAETVSEGLQNAVEALAEKIENIDIESTDSEETIAKSSADYARIFDIEIWDGDQKIEPAASVAVNIKLLDAPVAEEATPQVVHFAETGAEKIDLTEATATQNTDSIQFKTDAFSVYSVVYTVDFAYEGLEYRLAGGSAITLSALFEVLGIEQSVEDVESVEFSNPALVSVSKAEENTTVGTIKDGLALECENSSELTEEQIAEIDAQTVEAGEWVLISLKAFDTEESLTVRMKGGETLVVKVTDGQISKHVITADGEDYVITVTYGPEAGIPDGATLEARELLSGTEEYEEHYQEAWMALQDTSSEWTSLSDNDSNFADNTQDSALEEEIKSNEVSKDIDEVDYPNENYERASDDEVTEDNNLSVDTDDEQYISTSEASLLPAVVDIIYARFFDISIIHEGKEIEPLSTVTVSVEYANPISLNDEQNAKVVHFGDANTEVINPETNFSEDNGSEFSSFTFKQDSFSVTATLTSYVNSVADGRYLILAKASNGRWYAMSNQAQAVDVTNNLDGNGKFKEVPDECLWTFTKNSYNNDYVISSDGRYLRLVGNSRTAQTASNIEVTANNKEGNLAVYLSNNDYWEYNRRLLGFNENASADQKFFLSQDGNNYFLFNLAEFTEAVDVIDTSGTKVDDTVHYIITDHYPNGDVTRESANLSSGQSKKFSSNPSGTRVYAGVTVTTGHDAVSIDSDGSVTVSYNSNVHLVHIDYYYKEQLPSVQTVLFDDNDKYDTKVISGDKYYELSEERIHTDKTASVVQGGDGRSFNLTLEAWNVDWNIATVGMVLDASGSMAWDGAPGHVMQVNSDGKYEPYKFLSQAEVNKILYTDYSDYSPAGYGNYTYFVYEDGKSVNEYAPLGYYDGSDRGNSSYLLINGNSSTAYASQKNIPNKRTGWYYVNTGSAGQFNSIGGSKEYNGISTDASYSKLFSIPTNSGNKTINFAAEKDTRGNTINNSTLDAWFVNNDSTGMYRKSNTYGASQGTPAQFYVDDDGYLHCFYFHSNEVFESFIYSKTDAELIKTEMLQDAIGSFTSTLQGIAPDSAIGMTRFSRSNTTNSNGFNDNQLPLINWTTDSASVIGALNQAYGDEYLANSSKTDKGYGNAGNLTVYDYGLTGNTSTQSGLTSFNTYLASNNAALTKWAQDNAKPVTASGKTTYEYDKYVIVFTDGKDTDQSNSTYKGRAKTAADSLKSKGYSVITVLLAPESAFDSNDNLNSEFSDAQTFLNTLNGPRTDKTVSGLNWTDTTYIARASDSSALKQVFVDIANKIAKTMTDMSIRDYIDPRFQLVDENDEPITTLGYHPELGYTLEYDSDRDMYYVEWNDQDIPTNNVVDNTVVGEDGQPVDISLWSKTIRVRAKDDFLGGNEVLSNANVENLNKVYPDGQPNSTDEKTSRTFPRTTVDPKILKLELRSTEDTMYLGEIIDATKHNTLESTIGATVDSSWYYEYLTRYGKVTDTDWITQLQQGTKVEIPYYYIPDGTTKTTFDAARLDPNNLDAYMKDQIGTLTYEWVPCDATGNEITMTDPYDHMISNTDDIHYRLKVKYTPLIGTQRNDQIASMIDSDDHERPVKDPVGDVQTEKKSAMNEGIATVHVVSGKLKVQKTIKTTDIQDYFANNPSKTSATFTFSLTRAFDDLSEAYPNLSTDYKDGYPESGSDRYQYPATITATIQKSAVKDLNPSTQEYVAVESELIEKLPIGTYTLSESANSDFAFASMTDATSEVFSDASTYGSKVTCSGNLATIYMGVVNSGVPATATVKTGSPYLNAQEAAVKILNRINPPVMLRKADMTSTSRSLNGAEFDVYMEVAAGTAGEQTDIVPGKSIIKINTVTSGDYIQKTGDNIGDKLAGYAVLGGFDANNTYYLVETKTPAGYNVPEWNYIMLTLTDSQINWTAYIKGSDDSVSVYGNPNSAGKTTIDGKSCFTVTIYNNPGVELPSTGGPGTLLFAVLGGILVVLSGVSLILWRRRRTV